MNASFNVPQEKLSQFQEILGAFGGTFVNNPFLYENYNNGKKLATIYVHFVEPEKYYAFVMAWRNMVEDVVMKTRTKKSWWQFWKPMYETYHVN